MEAGNQPGRLPLAGLQDYLTVVAGDRLSLMVDGMFPLIRRGNLGLMAFSPLGGGSLVPGREDQQTSAVRDVVTVLDEVAGELGVTRPQVCVAWVAAHSEVASVLSGAEKPEHVEENLKGTGLTLPASAMARLNAAAAIYAVRMSQEKTARHGHRRPWECEHRDRGCARRTRRSEGAYREYVTEEQRSPPGCRPGRMP